MSTWNMPPGVTTNDIPGQDRGEPQAPAVPDRGEPTTCSGPCKWGLEACPTPEACQRPAIEPATARENLVVWATAIFGTVIDAVLVAVLVGIVVNVVVG